MITPVLALGLIIGLIFVLWLAARDGAKVNEKLAQSKLDKEELITQLEIANDLAKIAKNAPRTRADAINSVRASRHNPKG
jgi:hypothetical protein